MKKALFIIVGVLVGTLIFNTDIASAQDYNWHVNKANKDADTWFKDPQTGLYGYYDYAWVSNSTGGDTINISYNTKSVDLRLNVYGRAESGGYYKSVQSCFSVAGRTDMKCQNQPNVGKTGYNVTPQTIKFDVSGLETGEHKFTMLWRRTTAINYKNEVARDYPSAQSTFTLKIVRDPEPWNTSGISTVSQNVVAPGQQVTWTHNLKNEGPGDITADKILSFSVRSKNGVEIDTPTKTYTETKGKSKGATLRDFSNTYTPTPDDVGSTFCERLMWSPSAYPAKPDGRTKEACFTVPHDYNITPNITVPANGEIYEGDTAGPYKTKGTATYVSGATKSAPNVSWQIHQMIYAPGVSAPNSGGDNNTDACGFAGFSAKADCKKINEGTEADGYERNSSKEYDADTMLENYPIGTKICFVMSVNKYNADNQSKDDAWRHSAPSCIIIAKKPKVQFWGADVRTGSNVYTGRTTKRGNVYGSWAEFAIMANKDVYSASRAELASTPAGLNPAPSKTNHLTFANTGIDGGNFDATMTKPAVSGRFNPKSNIEQSSRSASELASGVYSVGSNFELTESASISNRIVLKNPEATVRITGNIAYNEGPHGSGASLPQLIIIAKNIIIEDNVSRVDAWLISDDGYVSTCGAVNGKNWTEGLKDSVCNNRLTINGPIISDKLYLRRTFGESGDQPGNNPGTPAETINLRPDAYLYASSESQASGSIRTMNIKELPPRF